LTDIKNKYGSSPIKVGGASGANILRNQRGKLMLNYVLTFFVLAIVAAVLGFGGLAGTFSQIAQLLAVIFVVFFLAGLLRHWSTGRKKTGKL